MKAFLWVLICLWIVDIWGKASLLKSQDDRRDLSLIPLDIIAAVGLIGWAAYLLAQL